MGKRLKYNVAVCRPVSRQTQRRKRVRIGGAVGKQKFAGEGNLRGIGVLQTVVTAADSGIKLGLGEWLRFQLTDLHKIVEFLVLHWLLLLVR